jgi:hypothetical protein
MAFEKTTGDPLVDVDTDLLDKVKHTGVIIVVLLGSLNGLEEVNVE